MKEDRILLSRETAFHYALPASHLMHSLQHLNSLLLQRITTREVPLGRVLVNIFCISPLFDFFPLALVLAFAWKLIPGSEQWELSAYWIFITVGAYALALLRTTWRKSLFKNFRKRLEYVGEKTINLNFNQGELWVEEHLKYFPQLNFRAVLALDQLQPRVEIFLHNPNSDNQFFDEMRIHLGPPHSLRLPDWALSKLEEPIYIISFDNTNEQDRMNAEKKAEDVLATLKQRLCGQPEKLPDFARDELLVTKQSAKMPATSTV